MLYVGNCPTATETPIHVVTAKDTSKQLVITAYEPKLSGYEDQEETRMMCVICQYGETEPGTTMVALTIDDTTIVIRDVPAHICTICGEE